MSTDKSDDMVKGAVYLRQHVWDVVAAIAAANGVKDAEQVRYCLLEGLRVAQERIRRATGVTPGYDGDSISVSTEIVD